MVCRVRILTTDDADQIRNLLFMYFEEEVTSKSSKLSLLEKNKYVKAYMERVVPQGLSVGLFDTRSGELRGCCFLTPRENPLEPEYFELDENTPALTKLIEFDEIMMTEVPQIVEDQRFVYLDIVVVNPKYQNMGIATEVLKRCEELALASGHIMMITVANTNASQSWVRKCGFSVHKNVSYKKYEDPTSGKRIFEDIPSPNTGSELCYKYFSR